MRDPENEIEKLSDPAAFIDRLTVSRGLITAHNRRGQYLRDTEMHRWLSCAVQVMDCAKIDVIAFGNVPRSLLTTIRYAREFSVPVSLRTDGSGEVEALAQLAGEGLEDVLLVPENDPRSITPWLEACRKHKLPIRLLINPISLNAETLPSLLQDWKTAGVCSVTLYNDDPFLSQKSSTVCTVTRSGDLLCNLIADALWNAGIECRIRGFNREELNERACLSFISHPDREIYSPAATQMAQGLFDRSPALIRTALLIKLKVSTIAPDITDKWLTRLLFVYLIPVFHVLAFFARLTRSRRATRHTRSELLQAGTPLQESREDLARLLKEKDPQALQHGHILSDSKERPRYLDRVDRERLQQLAMKEDLAREARDWMSRVEPAQEISENWGARDAFVIPQYGATAWMTNLSGQRMSHILGFLERPFIISTTAGSGIAEAVGFHLAGNTTLLCPMIESRHTVSLYVNEEGYYVLMRDGMPIEPLLYPGDYAAPGRLSSAHPVSFVTVAALDIEKRIAFSPIRIWEMACVETEQPQSDPKYSVIIFCTRFARRLSAVLQCLRHQQNFDLSRLEVLVAFIPGLDSTEDVLESLKQAHPELTIHPQSFPKQHTRSKGYVLNQCMERARGDWIILLDADTMVPPNMFSSLDSVEKDHSFIFPAGRAMVGPQDTAAILLGDIRPWNDWNMLLQRADTLRLNESLGVPIGYCQCFRKEIFEKIRYPEYEHFQGADFEFGQALRKAGGHEYRLDFPVMHLDHKGSQWFGAERHF